MDTACLALTRIAEAFSKSPVHLEMLCGYGLITSITQMVGGCVARPSGCVARPSGRVECRSAVHLDVGVAGRVDYWQPQRGARLRPGKRARQLQAVLRCVAARLHVPGVREGVSGGLYSKR